MCLHTALSIAQVGVWTVASLKQVLKKARVMILLPDAQWIREAETVVHELLTSLRHAIAFRIELYAVVHEIGLHRGTSVLRKRIVAAV